MGVAEPRFTVEKVSILTSGDLVFRHRVIMIDLANGNHIAHLAMRPSWHAWISGIADRFPCKGNGL